MGEIKMKKIMLSVILAATALMITFVPGKSLADVTSEFYVDPNTGCLGIVTCDVEPNTKTACEFDDLGTCLPALVIPN